MLINIAEVGLQIKMEDGFGNMSRDTDKYKKNYEVLKQIKERNTQRLK
jgi:hypothetical protein